MVHLHWTYIKHSNEANPIAENILTYKRLQRHVGYTYLCRTERLCRQSLTYYVFVGLSEIHLFILVNTKSKMQVQHRLQKA